MKKIFTEIDKTNKCLPIFASAKQLHLTVGHTSLKTILEGFFIIDSP